MILKYFLPLCRLSITFWLCLLRHENCSILMKSSLFFSLVVDAIGVISEELSPNSRLSKFIPFFLLSICFLLPLEILFYFYPTWIFVELLIRCVNTFNKFEKKKRLLFFQVLFSPFSLSFWNSLYVCWYSWWYLTIFLRLCLFSFSFSCSID